MFDGVTSAELFSVIILRHVTIPLIVVSLERWRVADLRCTCACSDRCFSLISRRACLRAITGVWGYRLDYCL